MRKLLCIIVLFIVYSFSLCAQGNYDKCYFGTAGMDFSGVFPSVLINSQMIAVESAVSMCSENGDLLFYSNGGNSPTVPTSFGAVWNANHEVMENGVLGDSSGCISSFQGAVAFPEMGGSSKSIGTSTYYIFMRDCVESSASSPYFNSGLTYCEIDMDANNGLGKVVSKNNTVVAFNPGYGLSTSLEPVVAILNGTDDGWYVFSYNLDSLYSVEFDNNGIGAIKTYMAGERKIIFSPSREHVVVGKKLYNFDVINNELSFNMSLSESNFAFSPNGKLIYGLGSSKLVQYDLTTSDISASKITISTSVLAGSLNLAPDARIYFFNNDSESLPGYINCPNTVGLACDVTMNSIYLGGRHTGSTFTNIPANFLYYDGSDCNLSVSSQRKEKTAFEVYPNPTNGLLTISVKNVTKPLPFQILSIEGKVVYSGMIKKPQEQINISSIQAGTYFVDVVGERKRVVVR